MKKEIKVVLPKLGESILSATIVQWLKKEGEEVDIDDPLLEVTTDKVNSEIPSPVKGILKKIYAKVDEELKVGELLAVIETGSIQNEEEKQAESLADEKIEMKKKTYVDSSKEQREKTEIFLSPVAKILANKNNISKSQLEQIKATGAGGRISKRDIENHIKNNDNLSSKNIEKIKMTSMRKSIAKSMVKSSHDIPSASLISEIDVTDVLNLIKNNKNKFLEKHGVKLTITSFLTKAIAVAVQKHPNINASLSEDEIHIRKDINIGIAVHVDRGLVVPVITKCGDKSVIEIAKDIASLGFKARSNKLTSADLQEGTITMSNFGMGGALIGIPIIKYPEAAIIGIGSIVKKVAVLEDDTFAVHSVMNVSLTFDHRIIDGMYGCNFMEEFKRYIEKQAINDFS